jgi:hypothetical protein
MVKKFKSTLNLKPNGEYLAKTRWDFLPDPCPTDLKWILSKVNASAMPAAKKVVAVK